MLLDLRQSFANFSRELDILKQVEREQLGVPAGYEANPLPLRRIVLWKCSAACRLSLQSMVDLLLRSQTLR